MALRAPGKRSGAKEDAAERAKEDAAPSSLAAWAQEHADSLKVFAQQRDADKTAVDSALELVRAFIVRRGLVLFGGLAIDYAFRLKGTQLYPDGERPDFDVLSTDSVGDAYDLADALVAAGFQHVNVVRGIHVQTMRVRADFVWVADLGFAPPDVFAALPTLSFLGMRVIHPDYQRMDMHLAFCFPFSGAPREDVFHRWRKDLRRFNRLDELYPIAAAATGPGFPAFVRVEVELAVPIAVTVEAKAASPKSPRGPEGKTPAKRGGEQQKPAVALHGFAAYAALRAELDALAVALTGAKAVTAAPALALEVLGERRLAVEVPAPCPRTAHFAGPDPGAALPAGGGSGETTWYDPYMDVQPEMASQQQKGGAAAVWSSRGRLLAVTPARVGARGPARVLVAAVNYVLLFFLLEAHRAAEGALRDLYRQFYLHTLEVVRCAEALCCWGPGGTPDAPAEEARREDARRLFAEGPFGPSVQTLGDVNQSAAYLIRVAGISRHIPGDPPPSLRLPTRAGLGALLTGLPQGYYPSQGKARPAFNYSESAFFRRSGLAAGAPALVAAPVAAPVAAEEKKAEA